MVFPIAILVGMFYSADNSRIAYAQPFGYSSSGGTVTGSSSGSSSSGGGPNFSPVTYFEEVSAQSPTNDTLTLNAGNDTVGTSFILYGIAPSSVTCTGVRFYWAGGAGHATTIKGVIWQYGTSGVGTSTELATNSVAVSTSPSEYTIPFLQTILLVQGSTTSVSIYDTSGTAYASIGNLGNSDSIVGTSLDVPSFIATSYLIYGVMNGNGGASVVSPFSVYKSGDNAPLNIGVNFFPVEPVLTH